MCDKDINCFIQSVVFTSTDAKKWNNGNATRWLFSRKLLPIEKVVKSEKDGHLILTYVLNPKDAFKKFLVQPSNDNVTLIIGSVEDL